MVRAIAAALLLVLAGCAGFGGPGQPAATESSPDPTPTPDTPTTSATPTATVSPTPRDATGGNTFDYAGLSAGERRAFDAALENGSVGFAPESIRESPYVEERLLDAEDLGRLRSAEFVVRNGTYYRLSVDMMGRLIASYGLHATAANASENATVVALGDLSADAREPVRRAIENGSYDVRPGRWAGLPEGLSEADLVRYDGSHYEIFATVGDYWVQELTVEEA